MSTVRRYGVSITLGLSIGAMPLSAQRVSAAPFDVSAADSMTMPARSRGARVADPAKRRRLFERSDAVLGATFVVATLAVAPMDRWLAFESQETEIQSNRGIGRTAAGFRVLGDPGALIIGSSLFAVGRLTHRVRTADVGLHVTEAVVVSGIATALVKGIAGRARPYVVGDAKPGDFAFGRGFLRGSAYSAFPSGHTTVAFAAAAVATDEIGRLWPGRRWVAGPVLYGSAAAVGLSRMYHDKHWASDVVAAAAVGTLVGRIVVRHQHSNPGNRLDRWLLATTITPGRDGLQLGWSTR